MELVDRPTTRGDSGELGKPSWLNHPFEKYVHQNGSYKNVIVTRLTLWKLPASSQPSI